MEGYAKMALLMARHEDLAIVRRFRALNMQNILYLQAELSVLEEELQRLVCRDATLPDRAQYAKDWWSLSQSEDENDREQWEKFLEIREKLGEYNDAVSKTASLARIEGPVQHDVEFLRSWMVRPTMGSYPLLGADRKSYGPDHELDLIAIKARPASDPFSRWFTDSVVPAWHRALGKHFKNTVSEDLGCGMYDYRESLLVAILRVMGTVVASMLPVCSVVMLYLAPSNTVRLGLIVLASGIFALALALMTKARQIEVFAATCA